MVRATALYQRLRSGNNTNTNNANALTAGGASSNNWTNNWLSVRPALHFNKTCKNCTTDKAAQNALYTIRATALYRRLRSGNFNNTNNAYAVSQSGANSNGGVNNWLTVRPALHLKLVKICTNDISAQNPL